MKLIRCIKENDETVYYIPIKYIEKLVIHQVSKKLHTYYHMSDTHDEHYALKMWIDNTIYYSCSVDRNYSDATKTLAFIGDIL